MILPSLESWHTEFGNSLILLLVKFNIVRVEESWPEQNPLNIWNTVFRFGYYIFSIVIMQYFIEKRNFIIVLEF